MQKNNSKQTIIQIGCKTNDYSQKGAIYNQLIYVITNDYSKMGAKSKNSHINITNDYTTNRYYFAYHHHEKPPVDSL